MGYINIKALNYIFNRLPAHRTKNVACIFQNNRFILYIALENRTFRSSLCIFKVTKSSINIYIPCYGSFDQYINNKYKAGDCILRYYTKVYIERFVPYLKYTNITIPYMLKAKLLQSILSPSYKNSLSIHNLSLNI